MSTPLLENILNQPNTLREIGEYQFGEDYHALRKASEAGFALGGRA